MRRSDDARMPIDRVQTVMTESVTDIIVARARRQESMTPMVVASASAHVAVFVVLALMSLTAAPAPAPKVFMVSFNGSEGPRTGGANAMGGRAVEQVAPPAPKKAPEPPAVAPPKMVLPDPKPVKPPRPASTAARTETAIKPAVTGGDEVRSGSTRVDTGVKGNGFGLSSGGGPNSGVQLDVSDFCCMDYVQQVVERIQQTWKRDQGRLGTVIVRFTIHRDGSVTGAAVEKSSGLSDLDFQAQRAVQLSRLERLPGKFAGDQLTMHLTFIYER